MMTFESLQWSDAHTTAAALEYSLQRFLPEYSIGENRERALAILFGSNRERGLQSLYVLVFAISNNLFSPLSESSWDIIRFLFQTKALELILKSTKDPVRSAVIEYSFSAAFNNALSSRPSPEAARVVYALLSYGRDPEYGVTFQHSVPNNSPLMLAASHGRYDLVDMLLSHGANPEKRGIQLLEQACNFPKEEAGLMVVDRLLSSGINWKACWKVYRDPLYGFADHQRRENPLSLALKHGNGLVFERLLNEWPEAILEVANYRHICPYAAAICYLRRGQEGSGFITEDWPTDLEARALRLLLLVHEAFQRVKWVNRQDYMDHHLPELLVVASGIGYNSIIRVLVSNFKADVNAVPEILPCTALYVAASLGRLETCTILVGEFGAQASLACRQPQYSPRWKITECFSGTHNFKIEAGHIPLQVAARNGHLEVVKFLLEATCSELTCQIHLLHGFGVDKRFNSTPLAEAIRPTFREGNESLNSRRIECAIYLLDKGSLLTGLEIKAGILSSKPELINAALSTLGNRIDRLDHCDQEYLYCDALDRAELAMASNIFPKFPADATSANGKSALVCAIKSNNVQNITTILHCNPGYYSPDALFEAARYAQSKGMKKVVDILLKSRSPHAGLTSAESCALIVACVEANLELVRLFTAAVPFASYLLDPSYLHDKGESTNCLMSIGKRILIRNTYPGLKYQWKDGVEVSRAKISTLTLALGGGDIIFSHFLPYGFRQITEADVRYLHLIWPSFLARTALELMNLEQPLVTETRGRDKGTYFEDFGNHLPEGEGQGQLTVFQLLLFKAVEGGKIDLVRHLVGEGCDVNFDVKVSDIRHGSPLQMATSLGDTAMICVLLDAGADVNASPYRESTALQWAAKKGDLSTVRCLVKYGADVNARSRGDMSALQWAAEKGDLSMVRCLVEYGADVNAQPGGNMTALQFAASNGDLSMVHCLVKHGADVDAPCSGFHFDKTALQVAAAMGRLDVVYFLLHLGAKTDGLYYRRMYLASIQGAEQGGFRAVSHLLRRRGRFTKREARLSKYMRIRSDTLRYEWKRVVAERDLSQQAATTATQENGPVAEPQVGQATSRHSAETQILSTELENIDGANNTVVTYSAAETGELSDPSPCPPFSSMSADIPYKQILPISEGSLQVNGWAGMDLVDLDGLEDDPDNWLGGS